MILNVEAYTVNNSLISFGQMVAYVCPLFIAFIGLQFCALVLLLRERFLWLNTKMMDIKKKLTKVTSYENKKGLSIRM